MTLLRAVVLLLAVTGLTTTLHWQLPGITLPFDLFLLAVVTTALARQPLPSQLFGAVAGLLEDAFTGNIIGINALSMTIIAFTIAGLKESVLIKGTFQRTLAFMLAGIADLLIENGLRLTFNLPIRFDWWGAVIIVVGNTVAGLLINLYSKRRADRAAAVRTYEKA